MFLGWPRVLADGVQPSMKGGKRPPWPGRLRASEVVLILGITATYWPHFILAGRSDHLESTQNTENSALFLRRAFALHLGSFSVSSHHNGFGLHQLLNILELWEPVVQLPGILKSATTGIITP